MEYRKQITAREQIEKGSEDFGIKDAKGRAIGYVWWISREETTPHVPNPAMGQGYYIFDFDAPVHYRIDSHVTRDGKTFGALTRDILDPSLEAAKAALRKRIEDSRKQYESKG